MRFSWPHLTALFLGACSASLGWTLANANDRTLSARPSLEPMVAASPARTEPPVWPRSVAARLAALTSESHAHAAAGLVGERSRKQPRSAAGRRETTVDPLRANVVDRLDARLRRVRSQFSVGVHVRDLDSGETWFDAAGEQALNPASNQKLLVTSAALELLGSDYRFDTTVERVGDVLVLRGEGDPSLQVQHLHALAQRVVASGALVGVRRIAVDDTAFSRAFEAPGYPDSHRGRAYTAPSGALSLQFNTVEVRVTPTRNGQPVNVSVTPASAFVHVDVAARTGAGRSLRIASTITDVTTHIHVTGRASARSKTVSAWRRIADPGLHAGSVFARILAQTGDGHELPVSRDLPHGARVFVAQHRSAPLSSVTAGALKYSNNFTTEQLVRTLGWRGTGNPGDWQSGCAIVSRYFVALGQASDTMAIENGAGLSSSARLTARSLVDLVERMHRPGSTGESLLAALPRAGIDGTLRHRLRRTDGRIQAKTGTTNRVAALTGIARSPDGQRRLGFSVLVNGQGAHDHGHALADDIAGALADALAE